MRAPVRKIRLRAGLSGETGLEWSKERQIDFTVDLTRRSSPNKAKIVLYNLSDESISHLRRSGTVVYLSAGEDAEPSLVFAGHVSDRGVTVTNTKGGTQTEILASDGLRFFSKSLVSLSYPRGIERSVILSDIIEAMGIPKGYCSELPAKKYPTGWAFAGSARSALDVLLEDDALWSIQFGAIQILVSGDSVTGKAPLFSSSSGLVGSPTRQGKDKISVETVLRPDIYPGRLFGVNSEQIKADCVVSSVQHIGGDGGNVWRSMISGRILDD